MKDNPWMLHAYSMKANALLSPSFSFSLFSKLPTHSTNTSLTLQLCGFFFLFFSELCDIFTRFDLISNRFQSTSTRCDNGRAKEIEKKTYDLVPQFCCIISDRQWSYYAIANASMPFAIVYRNRRSRRCSLHHKKKNQNRIVKISC